MVKKSEKYFVIFSDSWHGLTQENFVNSKDAEEYVKNLLEEGVIDDPDAEVGVFRGVTFDVDVTKTVTFTEVN